MELSFDFILVCLVLEKYLDNFNVFMEWELKVVYIIVLQEWLCLVCCSDVYFELVWWYLVMFWVMFVWLLDYVVNIVDSNGNMVLYYFVFYVNFFVVQQLFDSGVCKVDKQNCVGCSFIMFIVLVILKIQYDIEIVFQFFWFGDINVKVSQVGQMVLMLVVSYGWVDVVKVLLVCEVDINV